MESFPGAQAGRPKASEFVFARLRYDSGDWDYNPKVAANVLNSLVEYTTIPVYAEEVVITADSRELLSFPFLFMTGHKLVRFSREEREQLRLFVEQGGFLFAMCGATETLELAIAGHDVDIANEYADGTPVDPDADRKMDWTRTMAFRDAHVVASAMIGSMSDIDGHQVNVPGQRQPLGQFTLFGFAAKFDPVASMLVQDHQSTIPDFYGVTTSFMKNRLKPGVTVLASEDGAPWVKYIHGDYGKGTWTFLGGHDPEDPQHVVGSPPTDLALHPSSPGYRLILNNVLFPAAKKKPLKT